MITKTLSKDTIDTIFEMAKERLESHEQKLSSSNNLNKFIRKA